MSLYSGWFFSGTGIKPFDKAKTVVLGSGADVFTIPESLRKKLLQQNNTGLGSTSVQGTVLNTQIATRAVLGVANTYMISKLTADELALILRNRDKFTFTIGVGDRRAAYNSRFTIITNWHGEDVQSLLLAPDPWSAPHYNFRLTFSGNDKTLIITDSHAGPNNYGAIRYFTIRVKSK